MGEREMILLMGAMLFFTMTTMSINRFCLNNSEVMMESEFTYYATSLAQGIIEEAKTRAFDVSVEDKNNLPLLEQLPGLFTNPYNLGPKSGESYPNFSDVDDYNKYRNIDLPVNTPRVNYTVRIRVGYVRETDINTIVYEKTFYKKMIVTVTSPYLSNPVILSHVFSYFEW